MMAFPRQVDMWGSQRSVTMFVGVAALRYQHLTTHWGVDNGVPQLPQTQQELIDHLWGSKKHRIIF